MPGIQSHSSWPGTWQSSQERLRKGMLLMNASRGHREPWLVRERALGTWRPHLVKGMGNQPGQLAPQRKGLEGWQVVMGGASHSALWPEGTSVSGKLDTGVLGMRPECQPALTGKFHLFVN